MGEASEHDDRGKDPASDEAGAQRLDAQRSNVVREFGGNPSVKVRRKRKRVLDSAEHSYRKDGRANQDYYDPNRSRAQKEEDQWTRSRRKRSSGKQRKRLAIWISLAVVSGVLAIAGMVLFYIFREKKRDLGKDPIARILTEADPALMGEASSSQNARRLDLENLDEIELVALQLPTLRRRAFEILEVISKAESVDELRPFMRFYPGLEQDLKTWLAQAGLSSRPRPKAVFVHVAEADGRPCLHLLGETMDFHYFVSYLVEEEGEWLFDWESFIAKSEIPIRTLAEQGSKDLVHVRAMLSEGAFFTPPVFNDKDWSCYLARTMDPNVYVWAYTPRGGEIDRTLQHFLEGRFISFGEGSTSAPKMSSGMKAFRLKLRPAYGAQFPGQFEIAEVLSHGWLENREGEADE